jgi:hypothetical protein
VRLTEGGRRAAMSWRKAGRIDCTCPPFRSTTAASWIAAVDRHADAIDGDVA